MEGDQQLVGSPLLHCGGQPLVQGLGQPGHAAGGCLGQHLGSGKDHPLGDPLGPPLASRLEEPHGVYFVVKKLQAQGQGPGRGKYIQNTAPKGKLSHAFHLVTTGITGGGKLFSELVQIIPFPLPEDKAELIQPFRRNGALKQGLGGGHQKGDLSLPKRPEYPQPFMLPLPGGHGGVVEGKLPGRQQKDLLPGKRAQIGLELFSLGLVGAEQHHRAAGPFPKSGGKISPVDRGQAGNSGRRPP